MFYFVNLRGCVRDLEDCMCIGLVYLFFWFTFLCQPALPYAALSFIPIILNDGFSPNHRALCRPNECLPLTGVWGGSRLHCFGIC